VPFFFFFRPFGFFFIISFVDDDTEMFPPSEGEGVTFPLRQEFLLNDFSFFETGSGVTARFYFPSGVLSRCFFFFSCFPKAMLSPPSFNLPLRRIFSDSNF